MELVSPTQWPRVLELISRQRPTTHFNILVTTVAIALTHRNEALYAVVRDEMECVRTEVQG
jgi:hypothetical protein